MTRDEFQTLGDYAMSLWPAWQPTDAQRESWYHEMRATPLDIARLALHNAFTRTKWKEPALPDVLNAIRELRRGKAQRESQDFPLELVNQVQQDTAEESEQLAHWDQLDFDNGKAEVIDHEPGMFTFEGMPSRGKFWTHILVERYVHNRVATFPTKIRAIQRQKMQAQVIMPTVLYIDRAEYWKAGPQPRRTGIRSVSNGNEEQKVAQAAKVELQGQV